MTAAKATVLLVSDFPLSAMRGERAALVEQAKAFAESGHVVWVATPRSSETADLRKHGVRLHEVEPSISAPESDLPVVRNSVRVRRCLGTLMIEERIDLVVTHSDFGLAVAALTTARSLELPTIHTVHGSAPIRGRTAAAMAPLARHAHRVVTGIRPTRHRFTGHPMDDARRNMAVAVCGAADVVVTPTTRQARVLRAAGVGPVHVVPNALGRRPVEPPPAPELGPLRLVWASRFTPDKRLDVLLNAIRLVEIRLGAHAVRVDVAGGTVPPARTPVSVRVHGRLSSQGVHDLLLCGHAAVVCSLEHDGQPMTALEALRDHRPVIVSDIRLASEFGSAAVLTDDETAFGLATTIIELASDRTLLRPHTAAAIEHARRATAERHTDQVLRLVAGSCRS